MKIMTCCTLVRHAGCAWTCRQMIRLARAIILGQSGFTMQASMPVPEARGNFVLVGSGSGTPRSRGSSPCRFRA